MHGPRELGAQPEDLRNRAELRTQRVPGPAAARRGVRHDGATAGIPGSRGLAPESDLPAVALGLVETELKRPEKAVEALRPRRTRDPKDYLVNWVLAQALTQAGEGEEEAIAALEDAIRANPSVPAPHLLLGKLLVKQSEPVRATREFEEALKLKPEDNKAAYQLSDDLS